MRVEEMHLAAVADPDRRLLMMTGAIDTSDFSIMVRMELPVAGLWTVIKAKTNLTRASWNHWVIFLGDQVSMPSKPRDRQLYSRQFGEAAYFPDEKALVFGGGEVRPGEPLLTLYTAELAEGNRVYGAIYGSPSRLVGAGRDLISLEDILSYSLKRDAPQEDVIVPVRLQTAPDRIVRFLKRD